MAFPPTSLRFLITSALAVLLLGGGCTGSPRGEPATEGIANFGRASDALWRGAQPDERGLAKLKQLGAATIVNLRAADDGGVKEEGIARRHGLGYTNVPLPGLSAPDAATVARILSLLATSPAPVFVHCEHGADRTGTIIACYRIQHDGWSAERALAEAGRYGMSGWEFGMKRFVQEFAARPDGG